MTTTGMTPTETTTGPTVPEQAGVLQTHLAGYMATRVLQIGLTSGLLRAIAANPSVTPDTLADALGMDDLYVSVWCRAAFGAGVLDRSGDGYTLAPHMEMLLFDESSPAFVGGMVMAVAQPEMFGRFAENLTTGERMWWDETSPEWIASVERTGRPFYTRLLGAGLAQVPGLEDALHAGGRVLDTACGAGVGVVRLATTYPEATVMGVDGDAHSIGRAREAVDSAGLTDRIELVVSPLEDMTLDEPVDVVINNISMHECRDIDRVTERVRAALKPGGWFVISDFPFPDTDEGLRSVPGRLMSGVQFFEAQIDDQLLPRVAYDELLTRHGFTELGWFQLNPVHAVTHGRRPV
ncbi:class I SAM-dependent methyltransferase [Janibacter cremeus]|uniref:class I SAM-dependent methyltransferase n=1 Tax=Janibacter cremeus TaxID=1285192 RepID=UPI0023F75EF7|nr:class I SAM-dependent methyltransferase [Janibacter cremeus]WEV77622.1 class I SAM-dependent methyltransferase [Janibacter cremeus]